MKRVLVACEESQSECKALRERGFEAYSCDLKPCSGGHPEWHIQTDVREVLHENWDAVIAHPPCTYLAKSGACRLVDHYGNIKDYDRYELMEVARDFFYNFVCYATDNPTIPVLIENPVPMKRAGLPRHSFTLCPSQFGSAFTKLTCYWSYNGFPTVTAPYPYHKGGGLSWVYAYTDATMRSKSFDCISAAIADALKNYFEKFGKTY